MHTPFKQRANESERKGDQEGEDQSSHMAL